MPMSKQPTDYGTLPPEVPREETVAHQAAGEHRFGGPEGGGEVLAVDGDGD